MYEIKLYLTRQQSPAPTLSTRPERGASIQRDTNLANAFPTPAGLDSRPERRSPGPPRDRILDRLVHNAYRLNLKGESMRKTKLDLTTTGLSE